MKVTISFIMKDDIQNSMCVVTPAIIHKLYMGKKYSTMNYNRSLSAPSVYNTGLRPFRQEVYLMEFKEQAQESKGQCLLLPQAGVKKESRN